jgi:hypothetical protein
VIREVRVSQQTYEQAHDRFGGSRSVEGAPSEYDFVAGPLAAAVFAFREFDDLTFDLVPAVRSYTIVDPFFGPVVFVAVPLPEGVVEIVDFTTTLTTGPPSTTIPSSR